MANKVRSSNIVLDFNNYLLYIGCASGTCERPGLSRRVWPARPEFQGASGDSQVLGRARPRSIGARQQRPETLPLPMSEREANSRFADSSFSPAIAPRVGKSDFRDPSDSGPGTASGGRDAPASEAPP